MRDRPLHSGWNVVQKKVIGLEALLFKEWQTLLFEIELILNNRPLYEIYDDDVEDVLIPNHLLLGWRLESTNFIENFNPDAPFIACWYKHLNEILSHFWKGGRKNI